MAFCNNCGAQLSEDKNFCGSCGQPVPVGVAPAQQQPQQPQPYQQQQQYQQQPGQQQTFQQGANRLTQFAQNTADETGNIDPADIEKNKLMGGFAYFLFFLPLIVCPGSRYGRFHANQGLVYLFLCIALGIVNTILTSIFISMSWRLWGVSSIISLIIGIPVLVIGIIGLINGFSGKAKELPLIGKIRIIK